MDHEKTLKELFEKYVDEKKRREIYWEAMDIIEDYNYLKAHIRRMTFINKNPFLFFMPAIRMPRLIFDFFWRQIQNEVEQYFIQKTENMEELLKIFNICITLFHTAYKEKADQSEIEDLIRLENILQHYLDLNINKCMGAFVGCSSSCENLYKQLKAAGWKE